MPTATATVREIAEDVAALVRDDEARPSAYLTDGVELYRMLGSLDVPGSAEELVAVEDCRTLDLVLASRAELARWRVRPVAAAA